VRGAPGSRAIAWGEGATVAEVSEVWQGGDDPSLANQFGWNCRVHAEYEGGEAAVDWYVPSGTPVYSTMDGTAALYINTFVNAFDYYGVDREPYLGNPDRERAPIAPFPGLSGGMGMWVSVQSATYRTDYGHLELPSTLANVPPTIFVGDFEYETEFAAPRAEAVQIATWPVHRGDVIGFTGDAGYSEAPHLHYQIIRLSDGAQLCPTSEAGFVDGGWLEH
jgi:murein DD-endopeptidase MepM/ murein hydrolase activator NlpD